MDKSVPSIWKSVIGAYRDVFLALVDMPAIAIAAFVLSLIQAIASAMLQPENPSDITLATFLYWAADSALRPLRAVREELARNGASRSDVPEKRGPG